MERREGTRRPVNMAAEVENLSGAPGARMRGRVRDVSVSGLYLEAPVSDLFENSRLRLILTQQGSESGRTWVWDCFVVRLDDSGAGAMFGAADPSEVDGLLDLLRDRIGLSPGRAH